MTTPPLFFSTANKSRRTRRAISPVIATTIILAITVVLGLSLWSFANTGVSTATQSYADSVTEFGKFTTDRFVIASVAFDYPTNNHLTVWVYNSGKVATVAQSIIVSCKQCATPMSPIALTVVDEEDGDFTVDPKTLDDFKLDASVAAPIFTNGDTYQVQVISETGAHQTIYQKDE